MVRIKQEQTDDTIPCEMLTHSIEEHPLEGEIPMKKRRQEVKNGPKRLSQELAASSGVVTSYPLTFEFDWLNPTQNTFSPQIFRLSNYNRAHPDVFLQFSGDSFYLMMANGKEPDPHHITASVLLNIDTGYKNNRAAVPSKMVQMCPVGSAPDESISIQLNEKQNQTGLQPEPLRKMYPACFR